MNARTWRKIHRYLGLVIGIQLFLWTLSGLVFSWNSIRAVRGENWVREPQPVDLKTFEIANVQQVMNKHSPNDRVVSINLRMIVDIPVYEMAIETAGELQYLLVDAKLNAKISPVSADLAAMIAKADFVPNVEVRAIAQLDSAGSHSEYRGKDLPAFRIEMEHASDTVIYVSANRGLVTARRNDQWRIFDFFWMLHTMDYKGRDNFNNWLLKAVSVFGFGTVISGFVLWMRTSRFFRFFRRKTPTQTRLESPQ
jgi:uncharacterized iron-regulated membrane protein